MKLTLTNIFALIFFSFLLIGAICVLQNIIQDVQQSLSPAPEEEDILSYRK